MEKGPPKQGFTRGNELPRKPSTQAGTSPISWALSPAPRPQLQRPLERQAAGVPCGAADPSWVEAASPLGPQRSSGRRRPSSSWASAGQGGGGGGLLGRFMRRPADWLRVAMSGGVCSIMFAAGVTSGGAEERVWLPGCWHLASYSSGFSSRSAACDIIASVYQGGGEEAGSLSPGGGSLPLLPAPRGARSEPWGALHHRWAGPASSSPPWDPMCCLPPLPLALHLQAPPTPPDLLSAFQLPLSGLHPHSSSAGNPPPRPHPPWIYLFPRLHQIFSFTPPA